MTRNFILKQKKKHYIKAPTPTDPLDVDLSDSTGAHITTGWGSKFYNPLSVQINQQWLN